MRIWTPHQLRQAGESRLKLWSKKESEVAQSCPTLATPWTAAYQVPPSMGFSRQRYWSGLPFPSLGIFPTHRSNLAGSPTLQADALPSEPPGKLCVTNVKRNVTKRTMLSTPNQGPGGQKNSPESQSLPSQWTPSLLQHLMWWVSHPSGSFPSSLARFHTCNFHCVGLIHLHAHPSPLCCSPPPLFIQFTQQPQGPPLLC